MNAWFYLTIAIIAEVIGTSALKSSEGFTKLFPSVAVVAGYGIAFWMLSLTLKTIPVGIAYAVWAGAGIVLMALIGWVVFQQKIDPLWCAGTEPVFQKWCALSHGSL